MRILRSVRLSVRALSTHRIRTALAIAGAAVGVCGVLVLTAVGEGARIAVIRRIEQLGPNVLIVLTSNLEARGGRSRRGVTVSKKLSADDAAAILRATPAVVRVAPAQDRDMLVKHGAVQATASVLGTTPEWLEIRRFTLTDGRFFTHRENGNRSRVAVLGADVSQDLFADSLSPLGRIIRIGRIPFTVVGVLARSGTSVTGASSEDRRIVVPLETAMRRVFNVEYVKMVYVQADRASALSEAETQTGAVLRFRHDIGRGESDDFVVQNQRVLLSAELAAQTSFQRLITGLGVLALIVGGVGILSIMLLSVRERRREIGLRIAVGARRRDIALQFLTEALVLAAAGGAAGLVLGYAVAALVSSATRWDARVSELPLVAAVGSVFILGIGAGVLPARRAAALDPIDALQAE
jgi:putative ABC transport system permease protein